LPEPIRAQTGSPSGNPKRKGLQKMSIEGYGIIICITVILIDTWLIYCSIKKVKALETKLKELLDE